MKPYSESLALIKEIVKSTHSLEKKLNEVAAYLNTTWPRYTWVGFYFMNHQTQQLHLGPYIGSPTDHTIIPFGKGICGQVAVSGETYVADNVQAENNYIACSIEVKSEIVVPIYDNDTLVAQLDIDSNTIKAFNKDDRKFLEEACILIGENLGAEMHLPKFVAQK